MNNTSYQELIKKVSSQLACAFLENEKNIAQRALLIDSDLSEITRQIGREATEIVLKNTVKECTNKKKSKDL